MDVIEMMKVDVSVVLKQLLASYNVPVHVINEKIDNIEDIENIDLGFRKIIDTNFNWAYAISKTFKYMNEATLYVSEDMIGAFYAFIKLSKDKNKKEHRKQ